MFAVMIWLLTSIAQEALEVRWFFLNLRLKNAAVTQELELEPLTQAEQCLYLELYFGHDSVLLISESGEWAVLRAEHTLILTTKMQILSCSYSSLLHLSGSRIWSWKGLLWFDMAISLFFMNKAPNLNSVWAKNGTCWIFFFFFFFLEISYQEYQTNLILQPFSELQLQSCCPRGCTDICTDSSHSSWSKSWLGCVGGA